jgi:hypothetical protein
MSHIIQSTVQGTTTTDNDGAFELATFGNAAPPDALTARLPSSVDDELPAEPVCRPPTYRSHGSALSVDGRQTFGDDTEPQDGSGISALPPVVRPTSSARQRSPENRADMFKPLRPRRTVASERTPFSLEPS